MGAASSSGAACSYLRKAFTAGVRREFTNADSCVTIAQTMASKFDPTSLGLPADFKLTGYSRFKG